MTDHFPEDGAPEFCLQEGTCHYYGEPCAYCKSLAAKYDGWEPWEDATWD